ncbi:hypothetical protein LCI18_012852 [Fusarium solani-melongenae]|uniref:Uncharacterized protein n=1 Tax=Fusarium solani subsp. cucurbitae TaxID=2747967 RepID=A0ACD3ZLE4_FUSSC|nr:hypothetical protein LCI18_012852 [Fusarium solani-melongenae]
MTSLLCYVCEPIFRGQKKEQSRGLVELNYIPHHQSLEKFHDGISAGCVLCARLACHLASEVDNLQNLETLKLDYILYDYDRPGKIEFLIRFESGDGKDYDIFSFGVVPLSSATEPQQLCQPTSVCPNSESTFQLIQTWLDNCRLSHQQCCQRGKDTLDFRYPTRLIDTGPVGSTECRVIETDSGSVSGPYITLSHRWDFSDFLKFTSLTIKTLKDGLPIRDLPATFRDAVFTAQRLGIRYLWIDSLCIQQDSREDWIRESPTMRHVYGFATLNIVAGHSHGPGDGLFNARRPFKFDPIIVRSNWEDNTNADYLLWDKGALDGDFEFAPLTQRGWVFQERLLAPRILHFGKRQVYWRCSGKFACESWPQGVCALEGNPLRFGVDLDGLDGNARMEIPSLENSTGIPVVFLSKGPVAQWERLVSEYSHTELTRSEDRLVALSGVAKLFQQTFGDDYLAGLWWTPLERLLCWRRDDGKEYQPRKKLEYRAPSWSWASIDGPVCFTTTTRGAQLHWMDYLVRVRNAQVTPLDGDKMARVKNGYIKVEARLHSLRVISGKLEDGSPRGRKMEYVEVKVDGTAIPEDDFWSVVDTKSDCKLDKLWIMPTLLVAETAIKPHETISVEGLVLQKSSEQSVESDTYERIGYFIYSPILEDMVEEIFGIWVESDVNDSPRYRAGFGGGTMSWEEVKIV